MNDLSELPEYQCSSWLEQALAIIGHYIPDWLIPRSLKASDNLSEES